MRRILVVGATSAIATACARCWLATDKERDTRFFLVGRNAEKLAETAADLGARGAGAVHAFVTDLTDVSKHSALVEAAVGALGGIDIALIAHGTLPVQAECEQNELVMLREFNNNGTSVLSVLTVIANVMEKQRAGTIAVITSVAGDRGRASNYVYGSAKAAVSAFCEGLRVRLYRSGVHLVDIRPGFVDTPMTKGLSLPKRLVADPANVARRIVAGVERRADVLYTPAIWAWVMTAIRFLPRAIFKRLKL
jgi:decaprenylphospho-beta-D-erythro-pentofuranosid-2-ulose 2-reductase